MVKGRLMDGVGDGIVVVSRRQQCQDQPKRLVDFTITFPSSGDRGSRGGSGGRREYSFFFGFFLCGRIALRVPGTEGG